MNKALYVILVCCMLTGCKPGEEKAIQLAEKEVSSDMKDPESTNFRYVRVAGFDDANGAVVATVCGQVNSKNSFGAYNGFGPFAIKIEMKEKSLLSKGVAYKVKWKVIASEVAGGEIMNYAKICGPDK